VFALGWLDCFGLVYLRDIPSIVRWGTTCRTLRFHIHNLAWLHRYRCHFLSLFDLPHWYRIRLYCFQQRIFRYRYIPSVKERILYIMGRLLSLCIPAEKHMGSNILGSTLTWISDDSCGLWLRYTPSVMYMLSLKYNL
jgi:hypothetical protein